MDGPDTPGRGAQDGAGAGGGASGAPAPTAPAASAPADRGAVRRRRSALWAILLVGLSFAMVVQNWSDNQSSHYDLVRALAAGRTTIDYGPYSTKDKACYPQKVKGEAGCAYGHWYSARAPGLAMYSLPFYEVIDALGAPAVARSSQALRNEDEMIYFVGLWGSVLPGLILLLLVWRVAERFEPGYGGPTAVIVGLGTMILPFSTLLFSHVFSAMLGFASFAVLVRERHGPPRPLLIAAAGLLIGYAITSEYPLAFSAVVLGLYMLSRADTLRPGPAALRAAAYAGGAVLGVIPLLLYNHAAFNSWTHLAYSNIPQQQKGFFGISAPSIPVLGTLLFDSRGLLTLSPVLIMGAIGTVLLHRRGNRAEALTVAGICLFYLGYNSGYYLPFGGGSMGPRFLVTIVPYLGFPIALALRRFPAPTLALAGASIAVAITATITHPLVGYENETVVWTHLLGQSEFQPTIASAFGAGRGIGALAPFMLVVIAALGFGLRSLPRQSLSARSIGIGALVLVAWALFAILAPTLLGLDHRGLESIVGAGDKTALDLTLHHGARYPLMTLALIALGAGIIAMLAAALLRDARPPRAPARTPASTGASPALG